MFQRLKKGGTSVGAVGEGHACLGCATGLLMVLHSNLRKWIPTRVLILSLFKYLGAGVINMESLFYFSRFYFDSYL